MQPGMGSFLFRTQTEDKAKDDQHNAELCR
jgi:hypothetical protein